MCVVWGSEVFGGTGGESHTSSSRQLIKSGTQNCSLLFPLAPAPGLEGHSSQGQAQSHPEGGFSMETDQTWGRYRSLCHRINCRGER